MTKLCTKCKAQSEFEYVGNNKYKCSRCYATLHQCSGDGCNYMISFGWWCSKCLSSGMKKAGAGIALGVVAIVGAVIVGGRKKGDS